MAIGQCVEIAHVFFPGSAAGEVSIIGDRRLLAGSVDGGPRAVPIFQRGK